MASEEPDLGRAREHYLALMRRDVATAREDAHALEKKVRTILDKGRPENGLGTALREVVKSAKEAGEVLGRIEAEHFAGVRETVEVGPPDPPAAA